MNFGWGIVGRLYKGGTILVIQQDVGENHWKSTTPKLNLTGQDFDGPQRHLPVHQDGSDYKPVSNTLTYKDAIHILESE